VLVKRLTVGPIQTNCYVVGDERTSQAAVIDPGGDAPDILKAVQALKLKVVYVINTHAHFDHILADAEVIVETGAKLALHRLDAPLLAQGGGAAMFGLCGPDGLKADLLLDEGDTVAVGDLRFSVLHTPGHTPGSICLYDPAANVLFSGDLLFYQGIGRTDLSGGDHQAIMCSLERVLALPEQTTVYPGHGPETTIGDERENSCLIG